MAITTINIGTVVNDGTGDPIRTAFDKINTDILYLDATSTFNRRLYTSNLFGNTTTLTVSNLSVLGSVDVNQSVTANTLSITGTTQSQSSSTGAVVVAGGLGVGGNTYISGNLIVNPANRIYGSFFNPSNTFTNIDATPIGLGSPEAADFTTVHVYTSLSVPATTDSISPTTGALKVTGGVGIRGNANIGGALTTANLSVTNRIVGNVNFYGQDTIYINGSPVTTAGNAFTGGNVRFQANFNALTNSVDPGTGAVVIKGGLGVAGNISVGGIISGSNVNLNTDIGHLELGNVDLYANGAIFGNINTPQQIGITSVGALNGLTMAGNVVAGLSNQYYIGDATAPFLRVYSSGFYGPLYGLVSTAAQTTITSLGTLSGLTVQGTTLLGDVSSNVVVVGTAASTNTTTGALVVRGGVGVAGVLNIADAGDVSANIGTLFNSNIATQANLGAYQTYANANVVAIQSNLGSFQTYANAKIGTNTNSNLVVIATTPGTSTTDAALIVRGGAGVAGAVFAGGNVIITSTDEVADGPGYALGGALMVSGGAGVSKSLIVYGDLTVKGAILGSQSVASTYSGLSIFNAGIVSANIRSADIGNIGTVLTGTLGSGSALQPNITRVGVLTGVTSSGNILANSGVASTNTTTGALVVVGGVGISGALNIGVTGDVAANIGSFYTWANANFATSQGGSIQGLSANLGAYQTYANANIGTLFNGNATINANLGAYQTYANANIGTLFNGNATINANLGAYQTYANANAASQQTSINNTNANIGSFYTWANTNFATSVGGTIQGLSANLGAYQTYANANIGTLYNGNIITNANLGAYQTYANTNILATQANLGAYQTYANANIGVLFTGNVTTNANLGAFQTYANANIDTLFNGNISTNANLGSFQTYANANIGTLFNGNISTNANLGAFQTYANTKIGSNSNGNLVIRATTTASNIATGALVVAGGAGIAGATVIGSSLTVGQSNASVRTNLTVFGGNLAAAAGSTLTLAEFSTTNTNASYLQILNQRSSQGADWTTANIRIQQVIDTSAMGYIDFNPAGNLRAVAIGSASGEIMRFHSAYGTGATRATTHIGDILPGANVSYNLGSPTAWYNSIYGTSSKALYADLAEQYVGDAEYVPGTVVVIGGEEEVTVTTIDHDPRVAGVVSTDPAYLMNSATTGLPIALTGRVPCLVQGPVTKGALLVTSRTAGVAQAMNPAKYQPGCVIGKSLQSITDDDTHIIEIMVGRF